jgi:SAM-dependent methyltransferase
VTEHPIANVDMVAAWDGEEGATWAAHAEHYDKSRTRYDPHLLDQVSADDEVLDVGCGNGGTTREAARTARTAVGVDLSSEMIAYARERASEDGLTNVRFEQADAQVHPFDPESFDIAISRQGAMFFDDPVAAFANIGRALRRGGRIALLGWQSLAGNEWFRLIREALAMGRELPTPQLGAPGPFGLADPDNNHRILSAAGFENVANEEVSEPLWFGADVDDALGFLSTDGPVRGMLADLSEDDKAKGLANLREAIAARATVDGVWLGSSCWLVTATRP